MRYRVLQSEPAFAVLLLFLSLFALTQGHRHGHGLGHNHGHGHLHHEAAEALIHKRQDNMTGTDDEKLLAQAFAAMKEANKARVENPTFNKNKLSETSEPSKMAPALKYHNSSTNLDSRSSEELASTYSTPSELKEAARRVAESTDQTPKGNHSEVASAIRKKYRHNTNDTNTPEPLKAPYGKLGEWAPDSEQKALKERASGYWMVDMAKRGASPYAQSGYKVQNFIPVKNIRQLTISRFGEM